MEWLADPTAWLGLATLIVLELVLGIDNLVFIAILADKLPPHQRDRARILGLSLALIMRLGLLASISWMVTLTEPLLEVFGKSFSGRDLIMLFGGVFLLFKATMELHERLEGHVAQKTGNLRYAAFWPIVAQIVVLDAVFSLDAVITAVGMVDELSIMMIAVIFSIGLMIVASKPLTRFVNSHPTVIMLCLGFLMMIGFSLTAEGLGFHIPKGYLYAAIGFSILIEVFNQIARARRKHKHQDRPMRERTAHAVLRLLGGRRLEAEEVDEEIVDMVASDQDSQPVLFDRRERVMISGVLSLAERPIRTIMTARTQIAHLDLADSAEVQRAKLLDSSYSRLPLIREGRIDEPLGFVHKKELLRALLDGHSPDLAVLVRKTINLLEDFSILNALEQMRSESTHIAFVVNEFGDFTGLLTMTDILESIAGQLPDASEVQDPDIVEHEGGYRVAGALNLARLGRIGFTARPTDDYQTVAGLVMSLLDRLPSKGDTVQWQDWRISVLDVQERRVQQVAMVQVATAL